VRRESVVVGDKGPEVRVVRVGSRWRNVGRGSTRRCVVARAGVERVETGILAIKMHVLRIELPVLYSELLENEGKLLINLDGGRGVCVLELLSCESR
jgi:hypothetical protein